MFGKIVMTCINEQSKKQKKINFNKKEKKFAKTVEKSWRIVYNGNVHKLWRDG